MNELEVKRIPFMGSELMAAKDGADQIWAGVSFLCNGLGLSKSQKDTQIQNIQSDTVLSGGVLEISSRGI